MEKNRILVVDDELSMRQFLEILLKKDGYEVESAENGKKALEKLKNSKYSVILMDYNMPESIDGIELLNEIRHRAPRSQVVVITAYASTEQAIKAIELGAVDYVSKPFNVAEIRDIVEKCISKQQETDEKYKEKIASNERKVSSNEEKLSEDIIAESPQMKKIFEIAAQIAPTDSTVLITGDSGTGKEVVARYIHAKSGRNKKPWYPVNCGAIPENLLESELFGHEKGSFTGAYQTRKGYFEVAADGTLFLDEIGELSENMQVKLLRVLQEKNFTRVGGTEKITTNVRLIAATNKNLKEQMSKGKFREDLYFRLNVLEIYIPPLNERREDIIPLAQMFLKQFSLKSGIEFKFSDEMIEFFNSFQFPGNVREVKNIVERGTVFAKNGILEKTHYENSGMISEKLSKELSLEAGQKVDLDQILADIEKKYITEALKKTNFNRHETCVMLNITERSLRYRITKLNIKDERND
ncbi:MAG TPA: sigma-54 dependent transcriptional regulator [bacterium]|nr:sigma-54 dependent transcriptional regulator [bacterium]HPS28742.1 sigma-54 dependent transcriptional regulator [bacterium]